MTKYIFYTALATLMLLTFPSMAKDTDCSSGSSFSSNCSEKSRADLSSKQGEVKMSENNVNHNNDSTWEKTKDVSSDAWEATKDGTAKAWDKTKEVSSDAWEATKDASGNVWDATKEVSSDAWEATKDGAAKVGDAID